MSLILLLALSSSTAIVAAQTTTIISGDGPRPPQVTASAASGSYVIPTASVTVSGAVLPPPSFTGMGRQLQINGPTDFCLLLPPDPTSQNLVDAEAQAVAYCIHPYNNTRPMPDGFILTAHYRETSDYVQISGTYDPTRMNFNPNDCGGEYDNHGAEGVGNPVGAAVDGATNFAQFIGGCDIPGSATFCLRACHGDNSYAYCKNTYDLMGCLWVMPGDYTEAGFDSCSADLDLPVGSYSINGTTSTFTQGMSSTPPAVTAPASSNCVTTASPAPSGVTYFWEDAVSGVAIAGASSTGRQSGASSATGTSSSSGSSRSGSDGRLDATTARVTVVSALAGAVAVALVLIA